MTTAVKIALAAASFAMLGTAADKPNFSGEWSLDVEKSNFGAMGGPSAMTRKIDHNDPELTMTQSMSGGQQGDQTLTFKYSTDGKETSNEVMGLPAKTMASWDGSALVVKMSLAAGDAQIEVTDRITLSDDGKVMTDTAHVVLPQGEVDLTYVLNKK